MMHIFELQLIPQRYSGEFAVKSMHRHFLLPLALILILHLFIVLSVWVSFNGVLVVPIDNISDK